MKSITATDIYTATDTFYQTTRHIKSVVGGAGTVITHELDSKIDSISKAYKDSIIVKAINDLQSGRIQLIYGDPKKMLPPFMPFINFTKNGERRTLVDLTYSSFSVRTNRVTGEETYDMDIRQLYSLLITAELTSDFDKNTVIPPAAASAASELWAKMFCKVLNKVLMLNTNRELYNAFYYFAARYFIQNILEMSPIFAEQSATASLRDGKNVYINSIESKLKDHGWDLYQDFGFFCRVMFDTEITEIHGSRYGSGEMNRLSYLNTFTNMYDLKSLFALASFPYFLYLVVSINNADKGFNRRIFEDVLVDAKRYATIVNSMNKDI